MQKIKLNLLDILTNKYIIFKLFMENIRIHTFKKTVLITIMAIIWYNIIADYAWLSIDSMSFFRLVPFKSIFCYVLLSITVFLLILIIGLIAKHIKYKTIVNIYNQNIHYQANKKEQVIIIPQTIEAMLIFKDKYFIYQVNKQSHELQFLTIIDRNDKNFNEQKFWQTHKLLLNEYFKGNLPLKPKSTNTQKGA